MTKRSSKKSGKLSGSDLKRELVRLFKRLAKKRLDAGQISRKLKIKNSKDSINAALESLLKEGFLTQVNSGKYKLNLQTGEKSRNKSTTIGIVDMTRFGAGFIMCEDLDSDVFIPPRLLKSALDGDKVQITWKVSKKGKPEGEVLQVIERAADHFIGTLKLTKQFGFVIPDKQQMPVDIFVGPDDLKGARDGEKVVVKITEWHDGMHKKSPVGKVTMVLGASGSIDIEMKSILLQRGFNLEFPETVLKENELVPVEISEEEISARRDMRDIVTFTIDPDTAKDFDDALSLRTLENGNYEIGIHIADVSHYVKEGSALDQEAYKRSNSVYLVDRVLPMLPEKLSNGVCSLRPHEEKLCFSAIFEFSHKGEQLNEWFGRTVIFSDRRFTYEEAQQVLETGEGDFSEELKTLNRIALKLRKDKFKKGAVNFDSEEVKFKLDEESKPIEVFVKVRKDTNLLIEDFMLLANRRVAAFIYNNHQEGNTAVPFVYRVHDTPDVEKVADFAAFAKEFGYTFDYNSPKQIARSLNKMMKEAEGKGELAVLQQMAIRTMAKAKYTTDNIGHYGLAFDTYTHFTSPIRRYSDVLVHRILAKNLKQKSRVNKSKLEEQCVHISTMERKAMEAERESVKYMQVEYLKEKVGEEYEGIITGVMDRGVFVEMKENRCEGMIRLDGLREPYILEKALAKIEFKNTGKVYRMGDTVKVKIIGADLAKRQIDLLWLLEE